MQMAFSLLQDKSQVTQVLVKQYFDKTDSLWNISMVVSSSSESANRRTDDHRYIPKTVSFIKILFYKELCNLTFILQ